MDGTIQPYTKANHQPVVIVNKGSGTMPIYLDVKANEKIILDPSASTDPDKGILHYKWFYYSEAGYSPGDCIAIVSIQNADQAIATIAAKEECKPLWQQTDRTCDTEQQAHIILALSDNGHRV